MPRTSRAVIAGNCYHLYNRGNNRMRLFHQRADYIAFLWLLAESFDEIDVPLLAACVMPNHVHLVLRPRRDDDLARWAHWLFTTHARRYHKKFGTSGRVWQGRYKASLAQADSHMLILLRYVERNALRANLVRRAEDWEWSSLHWRMRSTSPIAVAPSPVPLPSAWTEFVNEAQTPDEVASIRNAIDRQAPYGDTLWCIERARELGLEQSLAPLGRPTTRIVTTK
jgi:putative transposase